MFTSLSSNYFLLFCCTSLIIFSFLYFDSSSTHFILYKFDIICLIQFIFSHTKTVSTLSLSLGGYFFFLITLYKVDGFFSMCFDIVFFFSFLSQSLLSLFYSFFGLILIIIIIILSSISLLKLCLNFGLD